jgi:hypothetical protein
MTTPTAAQPAPVAEAAELPVPVKDLPDAINNVVTIGGVRYDLFERDKNGLADSGALVFRGRRILIFPSRYVRWMEARSQARR